MYVPGTGTVITRANIASTIEEIKTRNSEKVLESLTTTISVPGFKERPTEDKASQKHYDRLHHRVSKLLRSKATPNVFIVDSLGS